MACMVDIENEEGIFSVDEALSGLKSRLADYTALQQVNALLEWDMQTQMPPGGAEARSRHTSSLTKIVHELFTDDATGRLLTHAESEVKGAPYDSNDASLLRVARRDYDKARKLPTDLVTEIARVTALAHGTWAKARAEDDFKSFAPVLDQIVTLKKRAAECIGFTEHIYDALLDDYEPGLTTAEVSRLFADLRKELIPLVKAIGERVNSVDDALLHQPFDEGKQREFSERVIQAF